MPALSGGNHGDATPTVRDEATLRLLRRLARPGALVVVLEDLHWADPDTLAVIEYLGDNIWCEPLPRAGVLLAASGSASLERGALATAVDTLRRAVALRGHQASPRVVTTAGHRAVRGDGGSISVAAPAIQIRVICTPPTAQGAGTELRWIGRSPAGVGGVGL